MGVVIATVLFVIAKQSGAQLPFIIAKQFIAHPLFVIASRLVRRGNLVGTE